MRCQDRCFHVHHRSACHIASKVAVYARVKAATVETPSNTAVDSKIKPRLAANTSSKITPEEAADMYRDMKLGRDFEEM